MPASSLVVVDTDILIDVSREIDAAITALQHIEHSSSLAISVVTQMELIVGCRDNSELQILEKFLSRFQILALNEQTSSVAVNLMRDYRLSHGLLVADALIAATAISRQLPLLTKNQRDYRFLSELELLSYPL